MTGDGKGSPGNRGQGMGRGHQVTEDREWEGSPGAEDREWEGVTRCNRGQGMGRGHQV